MVKLDNVDFSYGKHRVLHNFSLFAGDGESVCLFGPSGCGKTTVLRIIAGLLTPSSGRVEAKGKISVVFQEDRLIPSLTVKQNLEVTAGGSGALSALGLDGAADKMPADLSGGMARRTAIARAVEYGGDILLLDEPFNGLDDENRRTAARLIRETFAGKTVIAVSHHGEDAVLLGARTVKMDTNDKEGKL